KLAFTEPWESSSEDTFVLTESEGKTSVSWSDHMKIPFIIRPMMMFMGMNTDKMDEMMGPDFEKGLSNIKKLAESNSTEMKISQVEMPATNYLGIRHKTTFSEVMTSEFFGTNYGQLMGFIGKEKIQMSGSPAAIYYSWNETDSTTEVLPCIPVSNTETIIPEGMEIVSLPLSKAVKAAYYGPYNGASSAHIKLGAYCKENNIVTGTVIEEYANDPTAVASESEILTNIYYLIIE
ncbi:GyrI-like domain-containing protein, partial [Flavobacteriales bacterium]|nr:GyrI-like domain-containing protein [Flavobacteriales bacterium]